MAEVWTETLEDATDYDTFAVANESESAGCSIDPNYDTSNIGSPSGWGSECMRCVTDGTAGDTCHIWYQHGSDIATAYFRMEFYIESSSYGNGDYIMLCNAADSGWGTIFTLKITHDGSNHYIEYDAAYGSAGDPAADTATISTTTKHTVEVKWDNTGNAWEWRLDEVSQGSDTFSDDKSLRVFTIGASYPAGTPSAFTICLDNMGCWDDGYAGISGSAGGSILPMVGYYQRRRNYKYDGKLWLPRII